MAKIIPRPPAILRSCTNLLLPHTSRLLRCGERPVVRLPPHVPGGEGTSTMHCQRLPLGHIHAVICLREGLRVNRLNAVRTVPNGIPPQGAFWCAAVAHRAGLDNRRAGWSGDAMVWESPIAL